jgi:hypothetical protein
MADTGILLAVIILLIRRIQTVLQLCKIAIIVGGRIILMPSKITGIQLIQATQLELGISILILHLTQVALSKLVTLQLQETCNMMFTAQVASVQPPSLYILHPKVIMITTIPLSLNRNTPLMLRSINSATTW